MSRPEDVLDLRFFFSMISILSVSGLMACGDDGPTGPPDGDVDTGAPDTSVVDTSVTDTGAPDAAVAPGVAFAEGVCANGAGVPAVATAPDGSRVAFADCSTDPAGVIVTRTLAGGDPVEMGPGDDGARLLFSPDSGHLLFGAPQAPSVRDVAGVQPAVLLTASPVEDARFVTITNGGSTSVAVVYAFREAGTTRIAARDLTDLSAERVLAEGADLDTNLELVSPSGRNVFVRDGAGFLRVSTETAGATAALAFDEVDFGIVKPGLGDTHGIAHTAAGGLVFRILEDDTEINHFAPADVDPTHPVHLADDGGDTYVLFVVDGNPSRHLRSAVTGSTEMLATADAWGLEVTPDGERALYPSGETLLSVDAALGGAPMNLIPSLGTSSAAVFALAPDSSEVAAASAGGVQRAPTDQMGMSEMLDASGVDPGSVRYGGDGARLHWLAAGDGDGNTNVLRSVPRGTGAPRTIAWDVAAYWAVPASGQLLFAYEGSLRTVSP